MSLRLTPANLIDAYKYLKNTAPFNKWKLPDADDLEFRVTEHVDRFGHFDDRDGKARWTNIAISNYHVKTSIQLLSTMAHECCHVALYVSGARGWERHGPRFKALAKQVCQVHGFELSTF